MPRDENYTPGGRAVVNVPVPMRVLYRFTKPGGHVLELRERKVTTIAACCSAQLRRSGE